MRTQRLFFLLVTALAVSSCGAKSPLLIPDVAFDATIDQPEVAVCTPGQFELTPRSAEVMLLIDRSNSMDLTLDGMPATPGTSRWSILGRALATALPPFETSLAMGLVAFPQVIPDPGAPVEQQCNARAEVDIAPGFSNAMRVVNVVQGTLPGGGTPTFSALSTAASWFQSNPPRRGVARYQVLATDGGPNCNPALRANTCVCTSRGQNGLPNCTAIREGNYNCLDDTRTIAALTESTQVRGIPTFVIGLDDSTREDLRQVLDRMAIAGGRPNEGTIDGRRYYSVRRMGDLEAAFGAIQRSIARCAFVTPSRPDDPEGIEVQINGMSVPRDATQRDGWDWSDRDFGELRFFGTSCDRAALPGARVRAVVGCRDGGG